ncbi:1,4-beta-xylanase [Salegentibacter salinarum]|uniref:endo-1,4-beta-xylanase n=1 Tax=Salegentibacter salinarum TaxID=447422 RepID=A0A2N0TMB7_9FLAO|nr:endo-1,4-beta-xylanase [Salegentibacter salinarum]PKD15877.1 1,4-beta-xylanase [Salegentibacter salinarum]SKB72206.1 Glycosyl hydrolase family 10 [Salegentibacter salinarum]
MKYLNRFLVYSGLLALVFSCADPDPLAFEVEKPEGLEAQEEINSYASLKSYIDSTSNANFTLGGAVSISDYINKGVMYRLINKNFDELTVGYGMKHGAIVQNNGSMNFAQVNELIAAADQAGTSIYGHTLTWHANQNASYLNGLLEPLVIESPSFPNDLDKTGLIDSTFSGFSFYPENAITIAENEGMGDGSHAIKLTAPSTAAEPGDLQFSTPEISVVEGHEYEVIFYIKSDSPGEGRVSFEGLNNNMPLIDYYSEGAAVETFQTDFSWKEVRFRVSDFAGDSFSLNLDLGYQPGVTYYIDINNLYVYDTEGDPIVSNLIENGDFESGTGWGGWGNNSERGVTEDGLGFGNEGKAFYVTNPSVTSGFWEVQTVYEFPETLDNGEVYTLSFWVKGDAEGIIRPELQSPDYSSDGFGQVSVTQEWQRIEMATTATADDRGRLIFSYGEFAGTVYIDNVSLASASGGGGSTTILEREPAVKQAIIEEELERWISAMLGTASYVDAWDVVNEPMDDGNPYELKSGETDSDITSDEFYWQDYLGKDYAVKAFKLARQYGDPEDLLFINDYNLEYNLDKTRGLIEYVEYIDSQGATVDGIGTQMHISVDSDRNNIAEMFQLLAETGKLIKVSELDVRTNVSEPTDEVLQQQADMYSYVVEAYKEFVPQAQRYGITVWGISDSADDATWLPGEFQGLWDENLNRKPAYKSFAEALEEL